MKFIDNLLSFLQRSVQAVIDTIANMFSFLTPVFEFIFTFFYGIFYFIYKLGVVVWEVIKIIIALFQFLASLIIGLFRTIFSFLNPSYVKPANIDNDVNEGIGMVFSLFSDIGFMNVFPLVGLVFLWLGFVLMTVNLFKK